MPDSKGEIRRVQILWEEDNGQSYHMTIDATVSEQHQLDSEVTDHPVEKGVNLSDHVRALPDTLTLNGVISNTPIFLPPDFAEDANFEIVKVEQRPPTLGSTIGRPIPIAGALLSGVTLPIPQQELQVIGFDTVFNRDVACYNALRKIRDDGTLVSLVTTLHSYASMALQSVQILRDAKSGSALTLTITAKQIRVGSTEEVDVPAIPTQKVSTGRKVPAAPATEPPPDSESVLSKLFG